jgi:hypothetical protein
LQSSSNSPVLGPPATIIGSELPRLQRFGASTLTLSWRRCRHSKRRRWKGAWWNPWLDSSRAGDSRGGLPHSAVRSLRRFYGRGPTGSRPWTSPILHRYFTALPRPDALSPPPSRPLRRAHNTRRYGYPSSTILALSGRGFRAPAFTCTATGEELYFCYPFDRCGLAPVSPTVSPRAGKDPPPPSGPSRVFSHRAGASFGASRLLLCHDTMPQG